MKLQGITWWHQYLKRNLPTQNSSPDTEENLVHLCITVVNSNSVELECIISGVCLLQTLIWPQIFSDVIQTWISLDCSTGKCFITWWEQTFSLYNSYFGGIWAGNTSVPGYNFKTKKLISTLLFVGFVTPTEPSNHTPNVVQFLCGSRGSNNVNGLKRFVSTFSFLYEVWKYCYCLSKTKLLLWAVTLLFFGEKWHPCFSWK